MLCASNPLRSATVMNTTPPRAPSFSSASSLSSSSRCSRQPQNDEEFLKPFFLMDWLEEFVSPDQDIHKLAELLQTPGKLHEAPQPLPSSPTLPAPTTTNGSSPPSTPKSSNRKKKNASFSDRAFSLKPLQLFGDSTPAATTAQSKTPKKNGSSLRRSSSSSSSKSSSSGKLGPQQQKQHSLVALGNGWNAKGLKKAQQGLWKDALACWDVALELRLPTLSPTSEEVANTWNNRGIALGKLGDYPQALQSLHKALEIRLQNHSRCNGSNSNNSVIISTYHNIANVHQQAGDYSKALAVFGHAKSLCYSHHLDNDDNNNDNGTNDNESTPSTFDVKKQNYSSRLSMARLCTAMGHVYYQVEQWVDARDAYHDAAWVYQQLQDPQRKNHNHADELKELRRDIRELDHKILMEEKGNRL